MKKMNVKKTSMMLVACTAFAFMAASCANETEKKIVGDWQTQESYTMDLDEYMTANATITMNTTFKDDKTYTYKGEMAIDIPINAEDFIDDETISEEDYEYYAEYFEGFPTYLSFTCTFKGDGKWSVTKDDELKIEGGKFETEANWDSDGDEEFIQTIIDESGISQSDFEEIVKDFPLNDNGTIKIKKLTDKTLTIADEDDYEIEFSKK